MTSYIYILYLEVLRLMNQKIYCFIAIFSLLCGNLFAQKYSNAFLEIGNSTQSLGMGNTGVAGGNYINQALYNPANIAEINGKFQVSAMRNTWYQGVSTYDNFSIAYKINENKTLGLNYIRFGIDNIPNTISLYNADGTVDYNNVKSFSSIDNAFFLTYAQIFSPKISGGFNVKVVKRKAGNFAQAWGFGIDAGLKYNISTKWKYGISLNDATSTFNAWSYNLSEEMKDVFDLTGNEIPKNAIELTLPRVLTGIQYKTKGKKMSFATSADIEITMDGKRNTLIHSKPFSLDLRLGSEVGISEVFFVRLGVNNIQQASEFNSDKTNLILQPSIGAGLRIKSCRIDYAMTNLSKERNGNLSHIVSILFDIDFKKNKKIHVE